MKCFLTQQYAQRLLWNDPYPSELSRQSDGHIHNTEPCEQIAPVLSPDEKRLILETKTAMRENGDLGYEIDHKSFIKATGIFSKDEEINRLVEEILPKGMKARINKESILNPEAC